ncbi:ethanolamine utilization protein EutJ [Rhodopseudomonas palustris]|uniref:Ethanolamine utilization protein EutJ n=1 Tax=Rhodopseudomonas palustris (strain BisB18) TaxID=316056 RepID=Q21A53_RHOPB
MYDSNADATLRDFSRLIRDELCLPAADRTGALKAGVDLGTANIVLSVVDASNTPVAGASYPSKVVRDGIVVDYVGAVNVVRQLKAKLEQRLGCSLIEAGTAVPPGILHGNIKAIANVVEAAGFVVADVSDEPTAAARVLGVRDGAVVDVGGGTTGISIFRDGKVVFTDDEATGGTHMTLVLAGAYGVSFEDAELIKMSPASTRDVFAVVQPVVEKMASIVKRCLQGHDVETIYVVGGACSFEQFEHVFSRETGCKVIKPAEPLLVTPLGIAMYGGSAGCGGRS